MGGQKEQDEPGSPACFMHEFADELLARPAGHGDADGGTCEDQVEMANPGTPPACATCLCTSCDDELAACQANAPDCQDEVDCAQDAAAGACSGMTGGALQTCVLEECPGVATVPGALPFLLCINGMCASDCVPD